MIKTTKNIDLTLETWSLALPKGLYLIIARHMAPDGSVRWGVQLGRGLATIQTEKFANLLQDINLVLWTHRVHPGALNAAIAKHDGLTKAAAKDDAYLLQCALAALPARRAAERFLGLRISAIERVSAQWLHKNVAPSAA